MPYAAFDLRGRIAIVTGAGRGLGRGMAEALAQAGATVICAGRTQTSIDDTAAKIRDAGGKAESFLFDAVKREDCRRLVEETAKRHGQLHVIVVNHGIALAAPATEVGEGDWAETIAVNLTGAFLCAQAAGRQMIAQGKGGSLILISSGMNENVKRGTPMGRRGTVAEIAGPVVFLASDAAGFVSGVCLAVDGGWCAL